MPAAFKFSRGTPGTFASVYLTPWPAQFRGANHLSMYGTSVHSIPDRCGDNTEAPLLLPERDSIDSTIDRKVLLSGLEARTSRARHCRSVPASVILYVVFITSILVRMPVDKTFDFEHGYVNIAHTCVHVCQLLPSLSKR